MARKSVMDPHYVKDRPSFDSKESREYKQTPNDRLLISCIKSSFYMSSVTSETNGVEELDDLAVGVF